MICPNCKFDFNPNQDVIVEEDILSQYQVDTVTEEKPVEQQSVDGVRKAEPVVSAYRERFLGHKVRVEDITPKKIIPKIVRQDGQLDTFKHKGESLFFGEGTQVEY